MRIPKSNNKTSSSAIKHVHIDKPIVIPRLPVVTNDNQRVKLVKKIESYCRASMEYGDLISYLRKYVNMDECLYLQNFKAGKKRGMIEIHHAPFTLFSLVEIVMRKHEDLYGNIDDFDVVEEVMRLHYSGLVGLVPLSITCHQLVHDDKLPVPLWCVYGRFVEFTKKYYEWIPDATLMSLNEKIKESREFKTNPEELKKSISILDVQFVYLDVDGEKQMESSEYMSVKNMA